MLLPMGNLVRKWTTLKFVSNTLSSEVSTRNTSEEMREGGKFYLLVWQA